MNTAMEDKDVTTVNRARDANRAAMPNVAAFMDELRAQGISARVIYARENGVTFGKKPVYENAFAVPRGYRMATSGGRNGVKK